MGLGILFAAFSAAKAGISISVPDWSNGVTTASTATYQTSINPKYRLDNLTGTSNISKTVFANMGALNADLMRHVPWFPYPRLAVAQLDEPTNKEGVCRSGWEWKYVDPITHALFEAVGDRPLVFCFATIPEWMFVGGSDVKAPDDPNIQFVPYEAGTQLRDNSFKEVVQYFHRIAQYYSGLGFVDDCGVQQTSKVVNNLAWWEVLNEAEDEHRMSVQYYDAIYDAVVSDLRKLLPNTKFVALGLGQHNYFDWFTYHLNRTNHNPPDIPLDGISYHQYVMGDGNLIDVAKAFFASMDNFVVEITKVEDIKHSFEASTGKVETFINEIGCGSFQDGTWSQDGYFLMCAATYAYLFAKAAPLQVEHFGMSQVIGFTGRSLCPSCPNEWPSTSMVNWYTGDGNARYWVLKMMIEELPTGSKRTPTTTISAADLAYAQAFVTLNDNKKKILIVSKTDAQMDFSVAGATGGVISYVDMTTGNTFGCAEARDRNQTCYVRRKPLTADSFSLSGWGTAIVTMP